MKKIIKVALVTFLASLVSYESQSSTSNVSSPSVKKGIGWVEFRASSTLDDKTSKNKKLRTRQDIGYGFTDKVGARLIFNQIKPNNDSWEHNNVGSEIKVNLTEAKNDGYGSAFHVRHEIADNDKGNDEIELKGIFRKYFGDWEVRNNISLESEVGGGAISGIQLEAMWQLKTNINDKGMKAGFEMFNNFGNLRFINGYKNQSHKLGALIQGKLSKILSYNARALVGISENADDFSFGLFIKRSF